MTLSNCQVNRKHLLSLGLIGDRERFVQYVQLMGSQIHGERETGTYNGGPGAVSLCPHAVGCPWLGGLGVNLL